MKDAAQRAISLSNEAIRALKQTDWMAMDDAEIADLLEKINKVVETLRRKLHSD